MSVLHNRVSQKELKELLFKETEKRITISFYRYFPIADRQQFRDDMYRQLHALRVFGRVYIAEEGINAQINVPESNFELLKNYLLHIPGLESLRLNIAVEDDGKSFWVLKVKLREKIVADGIEDASFSMQKKGKYVSPEEFNALAAQPGTIIVDMRNHYEYEVGHFEKAIEVPSDTFREQLPMAAEMLKNHKANPVIMYCTGGIRCEKASAYLLHKGFENVYHLEGGIINYTNIVKEKKLDNKFIGKNFVFDGRLGERITNDIIAQCHQCGKPADTHTNCLNEGCHLLFIQCDECAEKYLGCCTEECKNITLLPAEEQKKLRKGKSNGIMVFNKSRKRMDSLKLASKANGEV